jgi:mannose/fructose/N-acetylgalactosamine-specific phosphotransferase system component IID
MKPYHSRLGVRGNAQPFVIYVLIFNLSHTLLRLGGEHGGHLGATNSFAKLCSDRSMATQAKCADVIHVTLPAALGYRQYVIGVPQTLAHPRAHSPVPHKRRACLASCSL